MLQGGAQGLLIRKDKDMGQLLEAWSLREALKKENSKKSDIVTKGR